MKAVFNYLSTRSDAHPRNISAAGWSLGGGFALQLAIHEPRLAACVVNYGALPTQNVELRNINWGRWMPHLEVMEMRLGQVLYESGDKLTHVYFPTSSIVSLLNVTGKRQTTQIAAVGFDGLVGVSLFLGGESAPVRAGVQSAGVGFRLKASALTDNLNRAGFVLHLFLRYTQALITQMSQTALCHRHHGLDRQVCRWLLMSLDRRRSNDLIMTHEFIAEMLGCAARGSLERPLAFKTRDSFATTAAASPYWTVWDGSNGPANVMAWLRKNAIACFLGKVPT